MAKVQKVEDLIAWQKAEALAELVYSACRSGELARDFGLSPLPFSVPLILWQMKQGKSSLASSPLSPQSRENLPTDH